MEQRLVMKNEKQCIYLMRETNLDFYLIIPNAKIVKIVLGVFNNVTDEFVRNIPFQMDKAVVIPIINQQILTQINMVQSQSFRYLDQVLSFLINTSYKILTYNHIVVDSQVLLNMNTDFELFNRSFIANHQGRVGMFELFPKKEIPPVMSPIITETIEQSSPLSSVLESNMEEVVSTDMVNDEVVTPMNEVREPGFVSYILLGVLVAVLSLVFLYFIL